VADRQKKIAKVQPIKPIIQTGKKIEEVRQITKNILQDGLETKGRDKEIYIAVISMALMQYQEDVHDVESGVLTIKEHQSSWTAPQFNNM
jgi:anthranilate phosphoribosyltransferase